MSPFEDEELVGRGGSLKAEEEAARLGDGRRVGAVVDPEAIEEVRGDFGR